MWKSLDCFAFTVPRRYLIDAGTASICYEEKQNKFVYLFVHLRVPAIGSFLWKPFSVVIIT
jgi:hypothetical protein